MNVNYRSRFLLDGDSFGSSGAAVIVKNCVVKSLKSPSPQVVCEGALVQVWSCFDDVKFTVFSEEDCEIDEDCLVCKSDQVARVPGSIWGALIPLPRETRVYIAKNSVLAQQLASIDIGSEVVVYDGSQKVAKASVILKFCNSTGTVGVFYGIKFLASQVQNVAGLLSDHRIPVPKECDAVVDLRRFIPDKKEESGDSSHDRLPKSASHNNLRNQSEETFSQRHITSVSLDLSTKNKTHMQHKPNDIDNLARSGKAHQVSRSLDLPSSVEKRLCRDRACSSLDSESCFSKNKEVVKEYPLIPLPVLATRWHACETDQEENFYDVPRDARHRKLSEVQSVQAQLRKARPVIAHEVFDHRRDFCIGSMVEMCGGGELRYGVIKWLGNLDDQGTMAGVELEDEIEENLNTHGLFVCPPYKAYFVRLSSCRRDSRFEELGRRPSLATANSFGQKDCPEVKGVIPPITGDVKKLCGKNKGIQGHNNSCYLDATLFAMFAFTSVFDSIIYRPRTESDHGQYEKVQRVLRDEIVNPLRKNLYVRADRVMKLRELLEDLSSVSGLTSEEKDPEEFLNSLLAQILKAEPFLQLSSGQEAYYYQLFVEKDERIHIPTAQQLIEQSFLASDIKLKQLPACLIVQMPRFGKSFKMYPRIIPSTVIDVTDLIENSPRQCAVCGKLATSECKECSIGEFDGSCFCSACSITVHRHPSRKYHHPTRLTFPTDFTDLLEAGHVPRLTMQLFAVVCIETSHYVAFLKTDRGWVFFDSMADRKGEQNGYNIPEIVNCPELTELLSEEGIARVNSIQDERELPTLAKRLLCDAYMCMYRSPQVSMYK